MTDLSSRLPDTLSTVFEPETSLDKLLSVLDQQVPDLLVSDRGDLDEFGKTIANLSDW